jgi:hypothetical protein
MAVQSCGVTRTANQLRLQHGVLSRRWAQPRVVPFVADWSWGVKMRQHTRTSLSAIISSA